MEYRTLGKTGLDVSAVGIGGWPLGGLVGGPVGDPRMPVMDEGWAGSDDDESIRMIRKAEDIGVNLIDTAEIYGDGHSESIIGIATKGRREKFVISTKVRGFYTDEPDIAHTKKRVRDACEGSLRRLQSDYIDIYLLHKLPHAGAVPTVMEELGKLKEEGKIRWSGLSYSAASKREEIERIQETGEVAAMVIGYSIVERNAQQVIRWCGENDIGTMIASPLASGVLAGQWFDNPPKFDEMDKRATSFSDRQRTEAAFKKFGELRFLTSEGDRTMAQAAIKFILDTEGVTSVIAGSLRAEELEDNAAAAGVPAITGEDRERAMEIADEAQRIWKG